MTEKFRFLKWDKILFSLASNLVTQNHEQKSQILILFNFWSFQKNPEIARFSEAITLNGARKVHALDPVEPGVVNAKFLSNSDKCFQHEILKK